jgi:hypothetical protein
VARNREFLLSVIFVLLPFLLFAQQSKNDQKLILIHVDGISTKYFHQEADKGNLPNLTSYFGEEGRIDHTITYFPSKTPTVIASIRDGVTPDMAALAGWIQTDGDEGAVKGMISTFLQMAFSKSRMATTNLIYGIPVLDNLAGLALQNTVTYLKDYDVLQFYWYKTDTHAHFYGEDAYRNQLSEFDSQFGKLTRRLPDDVDIIIYSDHGLTFGEGVDLGDVVKEVVGEELKAYSFPTLYLDRKDNREMHAKNLVQQTEIDVTFFQLDETTVKGIHENGEIYFQEINRSVKYYYTGDDLLGYSEIGYDGEVLDKDDWLALTYDSDYPMAPINIYYFMENQSSGDIITLLNPDKYNRTGYSSKGNHGGFHKNDMVTPLFVNGADIESLYNRSYFWLPDLFNELDQYDFQAEPQRDRHYITNRYNFRSGRTVTEFAVSPTYRVYYGADLYWNSDLGVDRTDYWGKVDIFRSYLSRLWIGGGVEADVESEWSPFFKFRYDFHLRKLVLKNSYATNREFLFKVSYEVTPNLAFELVNFRALGLRIDF